MRKIKYPLFISDFDGTLVKRGGMISEYTKETIAQYITDGGRFAISTGRMPLGILHRAKELGLTGIIACGDGAVIMDIEGEKPLKAAQIPYETAARICEKAESMGIHIQVYDLWEYYCNVRDEGLNEYEQIVGIKAIVIEDMPLSAFLRRQKLSPCKILFMVDAEKADYFRRLFAAEEYEDCSVTQTNHRFVEFVPQDCSKGSAAAFIAEQYGVPLSKTVGVGDQRNDLEMIDTVGLGVAVQNAVDALKEKADLVCEYTNEEDAVAHLIEKYGYEEI